MPLHLIHLEDLADPRLDPYRNQRDAWLRAAHNPCAMPGPASIPSTRHENTPAQGLFLAEGSLVIRALLQSRFPVESVLATPARLPAIEGDLLAHAPDTPVYLAPPTLLESIVGFDLHRGLLAAGRRLPPTPAADIIGNAPILVLAEDLANHDNVGGLFRTVAALAGGEGRAGVLMSPRCCDPLYRKALRVSMGHALSVPFATVDPWPEGLVQVAEAGYRILALSPAGEGSTRRLSLERGQRAALLIGAEGPGLREETLAALGSCVERVSVPMRAGVDSLNVVVALALALDRVVEALE